MCLLKLTRASDIGQVLIVWGDGTRLCHLALKVFGVTGVLLAPGIAFYKWHTDPKLMSPHHRDPTDGANAVAKIFILSSLTSCTSIVKMPIITLCPLRTFFFKWECYFHANKDADFLLPCVFLFSMKWFCLFNFKIMYEALITTCS